MNRLKSKQHNLIRRKYRVRKTLKGTGDRPRLTVSISNKHVSAQLIDDDQGKTLAYVSSIGKKNIPNNMSKKAEWIGQEIAKKALDKKLKTVVFDRNGRLYHGRIKLLADNARKNGLEF